MNIGIDIMGGDYAPLEAIQGIVGYLEQENTSQIQFVLIGDMYRAAAYIKHLSNYTNQYSTVHTTQVIEMHEHPTKALKEKPDSSIAVGFRLLQAGDIDAFVSAGNTGAMMVGAMYSVKPIAGVLRPSIASPIPKLGGGYNFLLDVGANADCKPEHLAQFAVMGSLYAKHILKLESPRVALLNIGEEEGKGNLLSQAAYPLLKNNEHIRFVGNIEGRDILEDSCDVIVCEGFTGNALLKMAESFYQILKVKRGLQDDFLEQFDYEHYGGTPVLGVNAPVIIGHGISRALAFKNMIRFAQRMVESKITDHIREHFAVE